MAAETPDLDELRRELTTVPAESWTVCHQHGWGNRYFIASGRTRIDVAVFDDRWLMAEDVAAQTLAYQQHVARLHNMVPALLERLAAAETRAEHLTQAVIGARLQIEYLHEKFQETGSGNAVLARINVALAARAEPEGEDNGIS